MLHAHRNGNVNLQMNVVVFYFTIVAPVVYVRRQGEESWENASNTLNFISSVSSVITASQLAAGVLRLGR